MPAAATPIAVTRRPEPDAGSRLGRVLGVLQRLLRREVRYYQRQPSNLLPFLTYRCSSRCRSCSMWRRGNTGSELTAEQWLQFLDSLDCLPIRHVEPFGGDVLLRPDVLFPLIERAAQRGLAVDIPLNGVLIDAPIAARLAMMPIQTIYLSVDGVGAGHDQVRRVEGNFERIIKAVAAIRRGRGNRRYPLVTCNTTISRLNYNQCKEIAEFAAEAGFDVIAFEYFGEFPADAVAASAIDGVAPEPYYVPQKESLLLSLEQAQRLKRNLQEIREHGPNERINVVTRNIDFLTVAELVSGQPRLPRCYVCRIQLTIDPFGNVLPCPFFDKYHLGNIVRQPIQDIWNNDRHRRFVRLQSAGSLPMCRYCILGVERNVTLWQALHKRYLVHTRRGRW
jgi:MoaA/NifB/PqqE/SkfB family radical SAM enzyme